MYFTETLLHNSHPENIRGCILYESIDPDPCRLKNSQNYLILDFGCHLLYTLLKLMFRSFQRIATQASSREEFLNILSVV